MRTLFLIDTHTGGEPTRVVISERGGAAANPPREVAGGPATRDWLRDHADWIRRSILNEPRGCDSMVGAFVGPAANHQAAASIVFFNNSGYLGMCGHGLIGVVEALRHTGMIGYGTHTFETPVGAVTATLHRNGEVCFDNVPGYRYRRRVEVPLTWLGGNPDGFPDSVHGDLAYGGNWFFLVDVDELPVNELSKWMRLTEGIRAALDAAAVTGIDGALVDHVELSCFVTSKDTRPPKTFARNFVLCPGGHFDRSPCGTGTAAKVACLVTDGCLQVGQTWIQESIIGSRFTATVKSVDSTATHPRVVVNILGRAHVVGETTCLFDPADPFRHGIAETTGMAFPTH